MSETHEKRARAQSKKMKQKDKAVRKEQRREQGAVPTAPEAVESLYYFERDRDTP